MCKVERFVLTILKEDYYYYYYNVMYVFQSNASVSCVANGSSSSSFSSGLHLFRQLLANKVFLLLFVRTVEQQKDFGTCMKVHFASLLSVVLHSRMEYFTEYDSVSINQSINAENAYTDTVQRITVHRIRNSKQLLKIKKKVVIARKQFTFII